MAKTHWLRPQTLGIVFGAYVLLVVAATAFFSMGLNLEWYHADATIWIYASFLVIGVLILVGLGAGAFAAEEALFTRAAKLERMQGPPASIDAYFIGPILASVAMIGVSAALLPGSDGLLQNLYQLNTFVVLALAYCLGGLAAYTAATVYLLLHPVD